MAAERFRTLIATLRSAFVHVGDEQFGACALLSLLDHDAPVVASRFVQTLNAIEKLDPPLIGSVDANIAADLTYLDLARFDRLMRPLTGPDDVERVHAAIRLQRAASLALVHVIPPPLPIMEPPM